MNKLFGPKLFFIITISILIGCGILLFTRMVGRELILVVIFATIIVFFSLGVGLSWVYVTEKNIVIFKNLFMRTEYKWEKFDEITYSTQGSSGGDGKSFYASTSYRFFSHKILLNSIDTSFWGGSEKDELKALIFDKADEYGFFLQKLDA